MTSTTAKILLGWAIAYGTLRVYWALGNQPDFPPMGYDLLGITGWPVVALCVAAAGLAPVLATRLRAAGRPSAATRPHDRRAQARSRVLGWGLFAAASAVAAALVAGAGLLLLDLVGVLFPGLAMFHSFTGLLSRAGCLAGGLLLGRLALTYRRTLRDACQACGRRDPAATRTRTPAWAYVAGYAAVLAYLTRIGAQYVVGFSDSSAPIRGDGGTAAAVSEWGFLIGTALAGVLLPLALVHRFGRIWPRWTLPLAGRNVPRWLVLGPALVISAGIVAYFGAGFVMMLSQPAQESTLPDWFFWVAVPSYLVWGLGLGIAALAYRDLTRPACLSCAAPAARAPLAPLRSLHRSAR
jgi:hypothetical protein